MTPTLRISSKRSGNMALRNIVKFPNDTLRKKCREVTEFDERLSSLLDDMLETMYSAEGVGLAAPQVGVLRRVCVVDIGEGPIELVNPIILKTKGEQIESEACLSCPGRCGTVARPEYVKLKAQNRLGEWRTYTGKGLLAKAFCHETDHLDGVLFLDKIIEELEPEEKQ